VVGVYEHALEFGTLDLLEWLIAGDGPFCNELSEDALVKITLHSVRQRRDTK
jgi:hypothetical protein